MLHEKVFHVDKNKMMLHQKNIFCAEKLLLNVHKTFRRSPGRLLNVFCTFNLSPVSTGAAAFWYYYQSKIFREIISLKLCNLISVDKKIYALQLKQKSTAGAFHGISRNGIAANFKNKFRNCF